MKIIDINVGNERTIEFSGKQVLTYIFKFPINGTANVSYLGLEGDKQADLVNHGGLEKALYAYGHNHYPYWQHFIGQNLSSGALGENLTLDTLDERDICIGDTFKCNDLIIQATQFRQPCFKLAVKFNLPKLPQHFIHYGYSGVYFKVLEEGSIQAGDSLKKIAEHPAKVSVYDLFKACFRNVKNDNTLLEKAATIDELPSEWREKIVRRLNKA